MKLQKLERTLVDHLKQMAFIVPLVVAGGVMVLKAPSAWASPPKYQFKLLSTLGDAAPGGGTFVNDYEPAGLNNKGDVLFGADVSTGGEGVFLLRKGQLSELARTGGIDPVGGVFEFAFLGPVTLNELGEAAYAFTLSPFTLPFGVNSGVYRVSPGPGATTPVVLPGVTPAPGGGTFAGDFFGPSLNNRGDLIFPGIVPTSLGVHDPGEPDTGLGVGIFKATRSGQISSLVVPGDAAPGGGTFDWLAQPWVNDRGDVAFIGHTVGDECHIPGFPPQDVIIQCLSDVYVRKAASGEIQPIALAGDPAPGGGVYRDAFAPMINNLGDIVFVGDLTPAPDAIQVIAVFLHRRGETVPVARPGTPMPGGGVFVTGSAVAGNQVRVNNSGDVLFNAVVDTDVNGDGSLDTGLFVWSSGTMRLVARTGTVIPGIGTINQLVMGVMVIPPPPIVVPNSGAVNNDRGQVLFGATLSDGRGVLLLATLGGARNDDDQ